MNKTIQCFCDYLTLNRLNYSLISNLAIGWMVIMGFLSTSPEVAAATDGATLEEIVVTARKKEESLQDTPISITAFTASDLDAKQLDNVYQIAESTPNLVFNNSVGLSGSGANSTVFIRGVGQLDFTLNVDAGVGLYVDGVYISRSVGSLVDLLDVERVEVLRGPQGTLFGRNTIGGAINITAKKPDENFSGKAGLTVGRFDRVEGYASVNFPVSDNLYNRTSIKVRKRDGYYTRLQDDADIGDEDSFSGRTAFNWQATDNIEIDLSLDGTREREGASPQTLISMDLQPTSLGTLHNAVFAPMLDPSLAFPFGPMGPPSACLLPGNTNPACYNEQYISSDPFTTNATFPSNSNLDLWGISGTITWELENVTLKSITAYRDVDSRFSLDLDHSPLTIFDVEQTQVNTAVSQELQAIGTAFNDRLDWILGFYYLSEDGNHTENIFAAFGDFNSGGDTTTESIAAFTQATYKFNEKLSITAGVRYTRDERVYTPITSVFPRTRLSLIPPGTQFLPPLPFETTANELTPMVNLSYSWTDNFLTYFSYSEGFKGGGFTQRVADPQAVAPSFGPEFVKVYEVGMKFSGLGNRLRLNASIFHNDYSDIQVLGNPPGVLGTATINAGEADIEGFEVELTYLPVPELLIQAGIGYLDAEYTSLLPSVAGLLTLDSQFANAPKWSINGSASYDIEINGGHRVTPRFDWSYRSKVHNDFDNTAALIQKSYHLLNASLEFETSDEKWKATLSGKNLGNETYLVSGEVTSNVQYGTYALPRTWAISLERRF